VWLTFNVTQQQPQFSARLWGSLEEWEVQHPCTCAPYWDHNSNPIPRHTGLVVLFQECTQYCGCCQFRPSLKRGRRGESINHGAHREETHRVLWSSLENTVTRADTPSFPLCFLRNNHLRQRAFSSWLCCLNPPSQPQFKPQSAT
jgi:hypothetical protein